MFLLLARKNGYEGAEAFKSSDMDEKAMDVNIKKKLEDIRKQYGWKEQPRAESQEGRLTKEKAQGILPQWLRASRPDERDSPAGSGRHVRVGADDHSRPRPGCSSSQWQCTARGQWDSKARAVTAPWEGSGQCYQETGGGWP